MGLTSLFDIGKSALMTSQAALSATANNVANVNTPGYSRQSVKLGSLPPQLVGGEWIGRGVNIVAIERNYDSFIDTQINNETSSKGMYDAKSSVLSQVEDIFNESEYGLSGAMQDFFNSWNEVAANPEGRAQRIALLESSGALGSRFQSMNTRLLDLQQNINRELPVVVSEVNEIIASISKLNLQVTVTNGAPDTLDQRDRLINSLAEYVPLNRFEDNIGRVTIIVEGKNIVEPVGYNTLSVQAGTDGMYDVVMSGTGEPVNLQGSSGGILKGMIDLRDVDLQGYRDQLDTLAYNLAEQVNAEHSIGYGLNGATGQPFFSPLTTITGAAGSLTVAFSDPNLVAASSDQNELPGNNVRAQAISDLQGQKTLAALGYDTFSNYYRGLVSEVGTDVAFASRELSASESVLFQLETRRDEFAGVSLDEEAVNLVRFQRSYEAAARIIRVTEDMFDTIMNM